MARLNQIVDSDDEFPELSTLLRPHRDGDIQISERASEKLDGSDRSPQKQQSEDMIEVARKGVVVPQNVAQSSCDEKHSSKPLPVGPPRLTDIKTFYFPFLSDNPNDETTTNAAEIASRTSPRRIAKAQVDYAKFAPRLSDASLSFSDSDSFTDLSGFIVPDSASDEEVFPSRSQNEKGSWKTTMFSVDQQPKKYASRRIRTSFERTGPFDLNSSKNSEKTSKLVCPESPPGFKTPPRISDQAGRYSDLDEPFLSLRISPPRSTSPSKRKDGSHPVTPPSSPSKLRLQSPSKNHRVPPSPHRPSIDAFWSADVINDWNEQYSPKKALKSARKMRLHSVDEDDDELPHSESPTKSPNKSPGKKDRQSIDRRKAFDERKEHLAASFLAEVDLAVGDGQVAAMAESTGGIKIIWTRKLSSTAGRANWRREAVRSKSVDGVVSTTVHRHHASIELAEKVIDDEDRLTNVIAHEYCHLANFMISGIKSNPHGASFKSWAAKATRAFKSRNVNVTTKHTYEIAYKYVWACSLETCGLEYKRHSKSIDPGKHFCGNCKSKLVQVKPAPRKGSAPGQGKRSEYQEFVKQEHEKARARNPGAGFGEIMAILGREYRESKKPSIVVQGLGKRPILVVEEVNLIGGDVDDVVTKLDLLDLEA